MDRDALRKLALAALERAEQATQGPWRCFNGYSLVNRLDGQMAVGSIGSPKHTYIITSTGFSEDLMGLQADFVFIASSRSDVPALALAVLALLDTQS